MHSKKDFNQNAADKRLDNTMGDAANGNKVRAESNCDSMVASLLIDCLFGAGINEFLGDALHVPDSMDNLDIVNTIDMADEFWTDRQNGPASRNRGRETGLYVLGDRGALRGGFNLSSDRKGHSQWDLARDSMTGTRAMEQDDIIRFYSPPPMVAAGGTGGFSAKSAAPAPSL